MPVMPFENLSNLEEYNFVADSMLDVFVGGLSGYQNLKVLSKNTSLAIEQKAYTDKDLIKIYNVKYLQNGTITVLGENMRTNLKI